MNQREPPITDILRRIPEKGSDGGDRDWEILFAEMIRLARLERRRWQGNLTMETGALANEVYIKIFGGAKRDYLDRKHFYRLITKASRQVLINF